MPRVPARTPRLGFLLLACAALLCTRTAVALDPALDVSQYAHASWKVRDGFVPGMIFAIAQTPDGYLWLGTEFGLYRFDGVRAVAWQPPTGQQLPSTYITGLMVSRDGTLWIGTGKGLARWRDGRLTRYPDMAERRIASLLEDHEGTIWVGEWNLQPQGRLCAIRKGAVECYGTDGSLGWGALSLYEDNKGNLWVGGGAPPKFGFWHWGPGAPRFYPKGPAHCFAEDTDGVLLIGTPQGLMRLVDGRLEARPDALPRSMRGLIVYRLQRDREGGLWAAVSGGGLGHLHRGSTDVFTQADGLSGNIINILFEDREGNMWVATNEGVDRFRNFVIPTWSSRQGLPFTAGGAVLAGNDGTIWASVVGGLAKLLEGQVTVYRQRPDIGAPRASQGVREKIDRGLPQRFYALLQDHDGRLWISSPDGLGYLEGEQFHAIPPFGTRVIMSLAEEPSGGLWVRDQENGLFHIRDGKVTQHIPWETLGHKDQGRSLAVDRVRGELWIGFNGGGVVHFKDGQVRTSYSAANGLGQGPVTDLRFGSRGTLWAATEGGLSRIRDGRVATLSSKDGLPCDTVHWSIEDNDHFSWLYMPCGLVRIARSDLDAWVSDPKHKVQPAVFDASDGVRTVAQLNAFYPQASKAPNGRIWFGGMDGVSVIDPRRLPHNNVPPPVHIEQITADRKVYDTSTDATGHLRLPPLIRDLQIDYTALSFVAPEKVFFRYRLEGRDRDWQEAGNRRQAFYTNLRPGKYRFLVAACNNSGVWNEAGAAFDFSIAPAYYQTRWFQLLCVLGIILLGWAYYRWRVRRLANAMSARFDERLAERTRVARELHDTLLQTVLGSKYVADGVLLDPSNDPLRMRRALEKLSGSLDLASHEARDALNALRASTAQKNDLAEALREAMEDCRKDTCMETSLHLSGDAKDMHPIAREEVYRIGYEAVRNACVHSQAKQLEVSIAYGRDLTLRVSDNGIGIDPVVADKGRDGHFGLHGMRERAARIGGKLALVSSPGSGTKIFLVVPGRHIFRKPGTSPLEKIREVLKGHHPSSPD